MKAFKQRASSFLSIHGTILCIAVCLAVPAVAAEFSFTPKLLVSGEYNDNVLDSPVDKKTDYITRLQPGAAATYRSRRLYGDSGYNFDYQNYARGTRKDEKDHYLTVRGTAELWENFLYIEASENLSRVSLDVARDVTTESLHANQVNQNRASISPYLIWRLGAKTRLKTGYQFIDTNYWGADDSAGVPGIDKKERRGFANLSHELAVRLTLTASYSNSSVATDLVDYDQHDVSSGFRYEYGEKSYIFGGVGNSWQTFSGNRSVSNLFWNAGISRDFNFVVAKLETQVKYADDPLTISNKETSYSAALEKVLENGTAGLSASLTEYQETLDGTKQERKSAVSCFLRYEIAPRLNLSIALSADRMSPDELQEYVYHLNGNAGITYLFNHDISTSLNYSYVDYRQELSNTEGAKQTHRLVLAVSKSF